MKHRSKLVWFVGIPVVLVTLYGSWAAASSETRWQELEVQASTLQRDLMTVQKRPVLFGDSTEGEAWQGYRAAAKMMADERGLDAKLHPMARRKLSAAELQELVAGYLGITDALRRGAHSAKIGEVVDWPKGQVSEDLLQNLLALRHLANLGVCNAMAQLDAGQPVAAVESLLDVAQLGRDLMHSKILISEMIGAAILTVGTSEVAAKDDLLARLSPAALERLAEGLTILDENMAKVGDAMQGEALMFANGIGTQYAEMMGFSPSSWRYGFSNRLMLAEYGLDYIKFADRYLEAARGDWPSCERFLSKAWTSEMVDAHRSNLRSALVTRFSTIARLRLLRMAVEVHRQNSVPALPDPYGDTLQYAMNDVGGPRFWSVGPDQAKKLYLRF